MSDILKHYGTPRHSGRYPWGSGENPQRNKGFITYVNEMKKQGMSDKEIAKSLIGPDATSKDLRARIKNEENEFEKERIDRASKLRDKGYTTAKIAEMMHEKESTVSKWVKGKDNKQMEYGGFGDDLGEVRKFLSDANELEKQGLTQRQIAEKLIGEDATSKDYRVWKSIATNADKKDKFRQAHELFEQGKGPTEIGRIMGENESTVRNWLKSKDIKKSSIFELSDILRDQVKEKKYVMVGSGVELSLNTTDTAMNTALGILKEEGYKVINVQVDQMGTSAGKKTTVQVLAPPGTTYQEVKNNKDQIKSIENYESDISNKMSRLGIPPVNSISSDRLKIVYSEDGGSSKDGVIELRRGLDDLNLGSANYAQVRIGVDDKYYLKGMAMYSDNMPPGVDVIFNTNKTKDKTLREVLKPMNLDKETGLPDKENPFGASIKTEDRLKRVPRYYTDKDGNEKVSPINVVYEEGDWDTWTKKLSAQMLAKQPNTLVKQHLGYSYDIRKAEFDEICTVNNPVVKRKLLEQFASDCDSTAVHLRAAALPRQASYVILPVPDLKENEIFAPKFHNNETVALIRFPHAGTFEIPICKVNNLNKTARSTIGDDSPDAVGIHPKTAVQLSGADFDGDSVLVIPLSDRVKISSRSPLRQLQGFDEQKDALYAIPESDPRYKKYPFVKKGSPTEQKLMGTVSNLITDMTLKRASDEDLANAVKYSMVVIDAAKHKLDYKQCYKDCHIDELIAKYQIQPDRPDKPGGASTLISKAKSEKRVPRRDPDVKGTNNSKGWDPETGEIRTIDKVDDIYPVLKKVPDPTQEKGYRWEETGKIETRTIKSTQMAETKDARTLISDYNTLNEQSYADYANKLKSLANEARKEYLSTEVYKKDPSASKAYAAEVASLNSQLNVALKNAPRERMAQLYAEHTLEMERKKIYPEEFTKKQEGKIRAQALAAGRAKYDAKKTSVQFSDKEWEAVQARAIAPSTLSSLLNNADMDKVRKLATPRSKTTTLSPAMETLIKSYVKRGANNNGYTMEEVADMLGISISTVSKVVNG